MSRLPLVLSSLALVAAGAASFNAFSGGGGPSEEAIRNYLVSNPGVVVEALQAAERNARIEEAEAAKSRIAAASDRLMDDGFSPVLGNPEGDVTLVMFSDYRCSYCKSAHDDLVEILGEDKNLRIIIKEFPILGEASVTAARFAHAVNDLGGAAAYAAANDALFADPAIIAAGRYADLAAKIGLDWDAVSARMESSEVGERIEAVQALGRDLGVQGTPNFVLDGQLVPGVIPAAALRAALADIRGRG
jgi:protein-disulfide isomerase